MSPRWFAVALVLVTTPACLDSDKGVEDEALGDLDDAKADSFQKPTVHGALAYDAPAAGTLAATAKFHAWEFDVHLAGQTPTAITVGPQTANGREIDTVLYLYKQQPNGRWGSYLARNDDASDATLWSALRRPLDGGRYRIIVKGYTASTYGKFAVKLACDRAACTQPAIVCAFGDSFATIDRTRFQFGPSLTLTAASVLDATTRAQVVRALHASSHTDVTTVEQAFARVDGGQINRLELRDNLAIRRYYKYEYGAGDNAYGAIFDERDLEPATEIHDGDFAGCRVAAATCLFGDHFDLSEQTDLTTTFETSITAVSTLSAAVRGEILAAATRWVPGVTTVPALLARVTDNEVRQLDVRHTPTGRAYTFITFILGDHRFGLAFAKGTTQVAVEVDDNVFARCDAF